MPVQRVRDIDLYYEIHGDGERVVLINGTGGDLRANPARGRGWLEKNFQVLMYDQRGLGQSGKPDVPYSMTDYADDCASLMNVLEWESAHVVGISFGGMVAQHVALRHPQRVNHLVLACTSSGGAGGSSFDLLGVHGLPVGERLKVTLPIMDSRNDLSTDPPALAPMFDILLPAMSSGRALNADDPNAAMGARRQLEARADHDVWDQLGSIRAHTFVVGGRYDRQAPVENVERLAAAIPDATVEFFEGGHLFLLQDPAAWTAIVRFLERAVSAQPGVADVAEPAPGGRAAGSDPVVRRGCGRSPAPALLFGVMVANVVAVTVGWIGHGGWPPTTERRPPSPLLWLAHE